MASGGPLLVTSEFLFWSACRVLRRVLRRPRLLSQQNNLSTIATQTVWGVIPISTRPEAVFPQLESRRTRIQDFLPNYETGKAHWSFSVVPFVVAMFLAEY